MKKVTSAAIAVAALICAAGPLVAQTNDSAKKTDRPEAGPSLRGDGPMGGRMRERMRERMQQHAEGRGEVRKDLRAELGLSDAQRADMRKALESAHRDRLRKTTDFRIASLDLRSLLRADSVDDKAVSSKVAEVQAAQAALLKLRVDSMLAMKKILTPEQRRMLADRPGRARHGRFGRGSGSHPFRGGALRAPRSGREDDADLDLDLEEALLDEELDLEDGR